MKKKGNKLLLVILCIVILISTIIFYTGLPISKLFGVYDINSFAKSYNWGNGFADTFEVKLNYNDEFTDEDVEQSVNILNKRLSIANFDAYELVVNEKDITVVFATDKTDTEEFKKICQKGLFEIVDEDGNVIIDGNSIEAAQFNFYYDEYNNPFPAIMVQFDEEGTELFKEATVTYMNKQLTMKLDGDVLNTPTVNTQISNGQIFVTGFATNEEAELVASIFNFGPLLIPATQEVNYTEVDGTLAIADFNVLIIVITCAIIFALIVLTKKFALVSIIMVLLSEITLLYLIVLGEIVLSAPTIFAIIMVIVLSVLTQFNIYNNAKLEYTKGKPMRNAVSGSYKRKKINIIDSYVVISLISWIVMSIFKGSIQTFATVLFLGSVINLAYILLFQNKLNLTVTHKQYKNGGVVNEK